MSLARPAPPAAYQKRLLSRACGHSPALQIKVAGKKLNFVRVLGLWAALTDCAVLQVKKHLKGKLPKLAKGLTTEEFTDMLLDIIKLAHASWCKFQKAADWHKVIFMYDNDGRHNVDKEYIVEHSELVHTKQLQRAPRYSGDFMQCIEHVHGIICRKWWHERVVQKERGEWLDWELALMDIFWDVVDCEGIKENCHKVMDLVAYLVEHNTGDYAPPQLV